jgi:hypothetical protein
MQRTTFLVKSPFGREEVVDAIMEEYGKEWGWRRDDIRDVEFDAT